MDRAMGKPQWEKQSSTKDLMGNSIGSMLLQRRIYETAMANAFGTRAAACG
jgi:hypothetical protein